MEYQHFSTSNSLVCYCTMLTEAEALQQSLPPDKIGSGSYCTGCRDDLKAVRYGR